ncbi:DUF4350 domain-containing protein [Paramicrobacterium sp. CJ85]|uniref:DUF4350 domain-containing protein n=1 Tax=Paramicrobacterium sp. CJ85 TaxID=3445355 RepID=UPI003F5FADFD
MTIAPSLTPTVRTRVRRSAFWVAAALGAIVVALVVAALTRSGATGSEPLQADSAAPVGAGALVNVLGEHGVDVTSTSSRQETEAALDDDSTLFVYDRNGYLAPEDLIELTRSAENVVMMSPDFLTLRELAPGVHAAGAGPDGAVPASCDVAAAQNAETAMIELTFRIEDGSAATGCFGADDDRYGMVSAPHDGGTLTILASPSAFTNDGILHAGNAALAINLLGESDSLVWYLPTIEDVEATGPPSLGDLTPDWVVPTTTLLTLTALAAMFWRGRRFGPVVVENMPVVVPARETVEGRARLYERGNARGHALDALRMGAASRIADMLGLPRDATVWQVADAAASFITVDSRRTRALLIDQTPTTDADLMTLARELSQLEERIRTQITETGRTIQ